MDLVNQFNILNENIESLKYAKERISELVDQNTANVIKLQKIADLVLRYAEAGQLSKEFIKEFLTIAKLSES